MDLHNRFDSPGTYRLMRLEALLGLLLSVGLILYHFAEVHWILFLSLFFVIDLFGYIPGAIAFRRGKTAKISRRYYVLYNTTHSLLFGAALGFLWTQCFGFNWALLAIPIHLLGDRALFGNFYKPFSAPFEPQLLPSFEQFEKELS